MLMGGSRVNQTYDIAVEPVTVPDDPSAIERGEHLALAVLGCPACHGDNLGGDEFINESGIATIYASNLTSGDGGVGSQYTDEDFARAIRHGVNKDGRGLIIMHSDAYHNMSEDDLAAVIAYVRSVPPVDNEFPSAEFGVLGRIFIALGMFDTEDFGLIAAEKIDHDAPFDTKPPEGPTAEYGQYLTSISLCFLCHGVDLRGGSAPLEEGMPVGPDLASVADWSEDEFVTLMRTGETPSGRELDPEWMPWDIFMEMTDEELSAIYEYLRTLS
jgi:mono/diheme cytochrome c family protein